MQDEVIDRGDELATTSGQASLELVRSWAAEMKDRQRMRLRVPDFSWATERYSEGKGEIERTILGEGRYRSIWNREKLSRCLNAGGFEAMGGLGKDGSWETGDGFLDVVAMKCVRPTPKLPMKDVHCIMSMPRLAWTDTMGAVHECGALLGFNVTRAQGVFWGQCLERLIDMCLENEAYKYILTVDYDSVFAPEDIVRLWQVMESNPDVAALCPLQIGRDKESLLVSIVGPDGKFVQQTGYETFHTDALDINTGHFGLTLIRTDALRGLKRPLFLGVPNEEGKWGHGRIDDDIHFWARMRESGKRICLCPKVRIGHLQCIIAWPGDDMRVVHQYVSRYHDDGRPDQCMTY